MYAQHDFRKNISLLITVHCNFVKYVPIYLCVTQFCCTVRILELQRVNRTLQNFLNVAVNEVTLLLIWQSARKLTGDFRVWHENGRRIRPLICILIRLK
jgi:hypothetical protein